jgi:hypothetical protein
MILVGGLGCFGLAPANEGYYSRKPMSYRRKTARFIFASIAICGFLTWFVCGFAVIGYDELVPLVS